LQIHWLPKFNHYNLQILESLSFTFPGTANGRFKLSWQNFRWRFSFHIFFLVPKEWSCIAVLSSKFICSLLPDTVKFFFAWRLPKLKLSIITNFAPYYIYCIFKFSIKQHKFQIDASWKSKIWIKLKTKLLIMVIFRLYFKVNIRSTIVLKNALKQSQNITLKADGSTTKIIGLKRFHHCDHNDII
jgi:hypothetical protein